MSRPTRFHAQELFASQGNVTTYRGLDPLTGLPVLIYRFQGHPKADIGILESENILSILESGIRGGQGELVAAYSPKYHPPSQRSINMLLPLAIGAFRGLADAACVSLVHGDLRPERLMVSGEHLLIEGFGVPWVPEDTTFLPPEYDGQGTLAGDVYALTVALKLLGYEPLSPELDAILSDCLHTDPAARPTAHEVSERLNGVSRSLIHPAEPIHQDIESGEPSKVARSDHPTLGISEDLRPTLPTTDTAPPDLIVGESEFDLDFDEITSFPGFKLGAPNLQEESSEHRPTVPNPAEQPDTATSPSTTNASGDQGVQGASSQTLAPEGFRRRPECRSSSHRADPSDGTAKGLPPGAIHQADKGFDGSPPTSSIPESKPQKNQESHPSHRRTIFLVLLLVAALLLAFLAMLRQRSNRITTPQARQTISYILDALVEPDNLPPVKLVVIESPDNSKFAPGSSLGSVPRKIVLDQPGTWRLQGRLQDRHSPEVTIIIPNDRTFTVTIPTLDSDTP